MGLAEEQPEHIEANSQQQQLIQEPVEMEDSQRKTREFEEGGV